MVSRLDWTRLSERWVGGARGLFSSWSEEKCVIVALLG